MNVFMLKSVLSIFIVLLALAAAFTMFEVFGRAEKKYNVERLKKLHRWNGRLYVIIYLAIAYFCLEHIAHTKAELSSRAAFHSVFSLSVAALLALKVAYVRFYKQFYAYAKTVGLLTVLLTFGMAGTSAGYYLIVTKFGTEPFFRVAANEAKGKETILILLDPESIGRGKELYDSKCYSCHDPDSTKPIVGPGHKGLLKTPRLPSSGKPATVENIITQIRRPYGNMPSFDYLSDEEMADIIAYLNTL